VLASLAPAKAAYGPLVLPVGAHSATLDTFGGGPGTVAFHGWPDTSVFGRAVTHGCVRGPPDALRQPSQGPLRPPPLTPAPLSPPRSPCSGRGCPSVPPTPPPGPGSPDPLEKKSIPPVKPSPR